MPELPDIAAYLTALTPRVVGQPLEALRIGSPFVLRSVQPRPGDLAGKRVTGLRRIGKRIALQLESAGGGGMGSPPLFALIHLMIAGRLHWKERGAKIPGRYGLAAFDFPGGTLVFTEAGTRR